jgi:hypothetical protein
MLYIPEDVALLFFHKSHVQTLMPCAIFVQKLGLFCISTNNSYFWVGKYGKSHPKEESGSFRSLVLAWARKKEEKETQQVLHERKPLSECTGWSGQKLIPWNCAVYSLLPFIKQLPTQAFIKENVLSLSFAHCALTSSVVISRDGVSIHVSLANQFTLNFQIP